MLSADWKSTKRTMATTKQRNAAKKNIKKAAFPQNENVQSHICQNLYAQRTGQAGLVCSLEKKPPAKVEKITAVMTGELLGKTTTQQNWIVTASLVPYVASS
jgi:hypothetical protein